MIRSVDLDSTDLGSIGLDSAGGELPRVATQQSDLYIWTQTEYFSITRSINMDSNGDPVGLDLMNRE